MVAVASEGGTLRTNPVAAAEKEAETEFLPPAVGGVSDGDVELLEDDSDVRIPLGTGRRVGARKEKEGAGCETSVVANIASAEKSVFLLCWGQHPAGSSSVASTLGLVASDAKRVWWPAGNIPSPFAFQLSSWLICFPLVFYTGISRAEQHHVGTGVLYIG